MAGKNTDNSIDMLHGPLAGKIVRFALPVAATSILQQLFNSADLAVVGRFDSSTAMAAVGSNAALINLLISLFAGLALGATVVIAALIGSGRRDAVSAAVHTSMELALITGFAMLAVGEILAPVLLKMMNTPDDVLEMATLYLRIYFLIMPFFQIYNFGSSILRAKGDSKRPLYALIVSGVINVALNIAFVVGLGWGVAGVAIATLIANIASSLVVLHYLMTEEEPFRFSPRRMHMQPDILRRIIGVGAPAGIQGMVFSISNVVIQSGINSFGAASIAGNTAAQNFEYICYFVINGFAQAATTFTSQNFAAGKPARCRESSRWSALIGMGITIAVSIVFYAGRHVFILFFTEDPEVIRYAMIRFRYIVIFEFMTGTYEISGGCLRGMNHSLLPSIITVLGSCVFRLVWIATVFQAFHTMDVLLIEYLISWIVTGTAMNIACFRIRKKEFARIEQNEA